VKPQPNTGRNEIIISLPIRLVSDMPYREVMNITRHIQSAVDNFAATFKDETDSKKKCSPPTGVIKFVGDMVSVETRGVELNAVEMKKVMTVLVDEVLTIFLEEPPEDEPEAEEDPDDEED